MSTAAAIPVAPATLSDLARVEEKAELIDGRIVTIMSTGRLPGRISKRILLSLHVYEQQSRLGEAIPDNVGYAIRPPLMSGRESFSPDVSFYVGTSPYNDAGFIEGAPTFAVEVRSEYDFGPAKDRDYADKRSDYFEAGTRVVWDVNYRTETIAKYEAANPAAPTFFRRGDTADAEPALPGWRLNVADLFA
ncbi:MAG TPA: Uma2 family endonuclease [Urbifossiella sp.]|nr:Uma2 family endonuclease [Urbifossiella sp.]